MTASCGSFSKVSTSPLGQAEQKPIRHHATRKTNTVNTQRAYYDWDGYKENFPSEQRVVSLDEMRQKRARARQNAVAIERSFEEYRSPSAYSKIREFLEPVLDEFFEPRGWRNLRLNIVVALIVGVIMGVKFYQPTQFSYARGMNIAHVEHVVH